VLAVRPGCVRRTLAFAAMDFRLCASNRARRGEDGQASDLPQESTTYCICARWGSLRYDFVFDSCANGQQLKCLTVVDKYTRECPAIDVSGSIRSARVMEVLSRLISERGEPAVLRSDNGPEFVSKAILRWAVANRLETALTEPGMPWQNGTNESFNGKFRDECLAMEWFRHRGEAKVLIESWRHHYNEVRPHSSLGQKTPAAFRKSCGVAAKPEAIFQ